MVTKDVMIGEIMHHPKLKEYVKHNPLLLAKNSQKIMIKVGLR